MNEKCPACRVIVGLQPVTGKLCPDCLQTKDVRDCYYSYSITRSVLVGARWFTFGYPIFVLMFPVIQIIDGTFKWSSIPISLICVVFWVFNVFYFYQKVIKMPIFGKWDKIEKEKQALFLAKLAGNKIDG